MKIKEHLLEAEEDKQSLAKEMEKLKVEHARMAKISTGARGMSVMAREFEDLVVENTSLEERVKDLSDQLEDMEDIHVAATRNMDKLTVENDRLEKELAAANLTVGRLQSSSMATTDNINFLAAEKVRLEYELTKANTALSSIISSLSSYSTTTPTTSNSSDTGASANHPTSSKTLTVANANTFLDTTNANNIANIPATTDTKYSSRITDPHSYCKDL